MRAEPASIHVGPAGWSYPDWEGRVYPEHKKVGFHPLRYLSSFVDCLEINSSFYATPRADYAEKWVHQLEGRSAFRLLAKLQRVFTHDPVPEDHGEWERLATAFHHGLEPVRRKRRLAALLVQFPVSFLHGPHPVRRLGLIHSFFEGWPLVLEVRHRSWFERPALDAIAGLGYSLAHVDLPYATNHPPAYHAPTGPIGYLRLHGRNSREWFRRGAGRDDRYDYLYATDELEAIVARARRMAGEYDEVFVVTNNHFEGKAMANAIELLHLLREERVPAPEPLVRAFPHLAPITRIEGGQPTLF